MIEIVDVKRKGGMIGQDGKITRFLLSLRRGSRCSMLFRFYCSTPYLSTRDLTETIFAFGLDKSNFNQISNSFF